MPKLIDLTGRRIGSVTVLRKLDLPRTGRRTCYAIWICKCDCGREFQKQSRNLILGIVKSCGCQHRTITHGHARGYQRSPTYKTWWAMVARCEVLSNESYPRYGGRGIKVCGRWRNGEGGLTGLECFALDIPPKPSPEMSLERINNDFDYQPGNVRWATAEEQANNRCNTRYAEYKGKRYCCSDLAKLLGVDKTVLRGRLGRGWTVERAISQPVRRT